MIRRFFELIALMTYKIGFRRPWLEKRALVSYVSTLPIYSAAYFKDSHNSKLTCYLICKFLNSRGYSVDLRRYDDFDISPSVKYSLFVGHTSTFPEIKKRIALEGQSVLLTTGSEASFGNNSQKFQAKMLFQRKGVRIPVFQENIVQSALEAHKEADMVMMMGSQFVKDTWYKKYSHKYKLINNVSAFRTVFPSKQERTRNFLFISSIGQVHRGLDILLDIFSQNSYKEFNLYVCSLFNNESEFVSLYKKELFCSQNIHPVRFLNIRSKKFKKIVESCDFVILPSCSEGQSSSVINAIRMGLVPIVTDNVGLPNYSDIGIKIKDTSIEEVSLAIDKAIRLSDAEFFEMRRNLKNYATLFDEEAFTNRLDEIFG